MRRSTYGAPRAAWNDDAFAAASPAVRKAWRHWCRQEAAWHAARGLTDAAAERRARIKLDIAIRRVAAIKARSLDDVAPKTMISAWLCCWEDDGDLLPGLEATIAAETTAINDAALPMRT